MTLAATDTVFTQIVLLKLTKMFGENQGRQLTRELTEKMDKHQVNTADQLKEVAEALVSRGGLSMMVGHSILVEALLRGAKQ
jgi:hypothetical protein